MEQRHIGLDAVFEQIVNYPAIMLEPFLVRLTATFGKDPRPGDRHAVGAHAEALEELRVLLVAVIAVAGDIAGLAVRDLAGGVCIDVPIGLAAPVLPHRAFDLVSGRRAAPDEVIRKAQIDTCGCPRRRAGRRRNG